MADMTTPRLSVVVPCYNEQAGLPELHRRVAKVCAANAGGSYELVLVNDGSTDETWRIMRELCAADPHVVAIDLSRNYGHQIALSAGLRLCRGERVLILDADLQDPPELLAPMMARMDAGADVVFGQRTERAGETGFKRSSAHLFYRLLNSLVDIEIPADTGDFRLISRRALDILNAMPEHHRFIRGMIAWIGLRQEALPYERAARFAGQSHYTLRKMLRLALDAITGFSVRPLRLASYAGLICSVTALLVLVYLVFEHFAGYTIEGWTSLAALILIIGAIQMFMMAIIGEYLGRLYTQSKGRPLYIVREITGGEAAR
jgi:dolichol-phosphate mannosyltransferase